MNNLILMAMRDCFEYLGDATRYILHQGNFMDMALTIPMPSSRFSYLLSESHTCSPCVEDMIAELPSSIEWTNKMHFILILVDGGDGHQVWVVQTLEDIQLILELLFVMLILGQSLTCIVLLGPSASYPLHNAKSASLNFLHDLKSQLESMSGWIE